MKDRLPEQHLFTKHLMHWHHTANHRSLPWKGERDPYKIWLSEIILQQTRAEQGLPYYLNFTQAYPTVKQLANTTDEAAYKLWQGLGYYNRCKNMLSTARQIVQELKGKFPDTYDGLLALKGVGPYTAAAIASFAYGLPEAVVDGNVNRVLARYFGIDTPIDATEGKKRFQALATELLLTEDSAAYNQAIMDLGATICTPALPKCSECPLNRECVAFNKALISILPQKSKKAAVRVRYFHYVLLRDEDKIWIQKRTGKDIWQNLYQPYLIECVTALDSRELLQTEAFKALATDALPEYEGALKQRLTHQLIETRFFTVKLAGFQTLSALKDGIGVPLSKLTSYAFPRTLVSFFEKKNYF